MRYSDDRHPEKGDRVRVANPDYVATYGVDMIVVEPYADSGRTGGSYFNRPFVLVERADGKGTYRLPPEDLEPAPVQASLFDT